MECYAPWCHIFHSNQMSSRKNQFQFGARASEAKNQLCTAADNQYLCHTINSVPVVSRSMEIPESISIIWRWNTCVCVCVCVHWYFWIRMIQVDTAQTTTDPDQFLVQCLSFHFRYYQLHCYGVAKNKFNIVAGAITKRINIPCIGARVIMQYLKIGLCRLRFVRVAPHRIAHQQAKTIQKQQYVLTKKWTIHAHKHTDNHIRAETYCRK